MTLRLLHYADIETAYDDPERIGRLAGLIGALRDGRTIVCGGGDDLGPGVLSVVTEGRQALDFFRAVEPDVETFGNHDFDHGIDALLSVVDASPQTWVCANAFRGGGRFAAAEGGEPWTLVESGCQRVGVVGIAHPETAEINPNASGVEFTDPIDAVERSLGELREEAVDRIVVISHLGDDTELARRVEVDAILGGHDHERGIERIDGTLVCRPGGTGRFLLDVTLDGDDATATHHAVEKGPLHSEVAEALEERMAETGLSDVVGETEEPIVCDMMACKRGESRLGNLITDAYRWKTGADVALNSGGGFRRQPPLTGEVTAFDLVGITPYAAELAVVGVDGGTLREALRQLALTETPDDLPAWHFGHVSGAELVWDDASGELRRATVGGEPVDPSATYELATSEFFVANDDLFPAFGPGDVIEHHGPQYEAVLEYVRETGLDPETEGRIRRPTLDPDTVPERDWPNSP